jgi:succinyl-CoA synthetase alpha subunit
MDVAEVERLIEEADERCLPLVAALVEMYGDGLARIVGSLPDDAVARLAEDPQVAALLVLHDLHPVNAENRVREAIAATGAYAVVVGVEGGVAQVRAADDGRRKAIEQAITAAAPDIDRVEFVTESLVVLPQAGG